MTDANDLTRPDPWRELRRFTPARIALGRTGGSLPTQALLEFQLAHALARDAVHIPLDFERLAQTLATRAYPTLILQSQAGDRSVYLQRPDLGRLLNAASADCLNTRATAPVDACIVVADGLSSSAVSHHAEPFLSLLMPALRQCGYTVSPVCLVEHGRVAIGDAIAETFNARLCIVLIGERPGLSSPDSLGIYFTYQAKAGVSTDADRNCISNIHGNGLDYRQALNKLMFLIDGAERLKLSGVGLKDETTDTGPEAVGGRQFFWGISILSWASVNDVAGKVL